MRIALATTGMIALLATTGCGGRTGEDRTTTTSTENLQVYDTSEPATEVGMNAASARSAPPVVLDPLASRPDGDSPSPPEITPDAAPDVAFGYRYSFGLPADQVAPVQQRHARLCEELGAERCRVTGMTYRRTDEDDVRAELSLAVEPSLAHRFGERALDSVREADGRLVDSEVTGTDVGTGIRANTRGIAVLEEQLADLQRQIASAGSADTRKELNDQADMLRAQISGLRGERSASRERLTATQIRLSYASGAYVTGTPDFGGAFATGWDRLKWVAYGLLMVALVLLPWVLAALAIALGIRALKRRLSRRAAETYDPMLAD